MKKKVLIIITSFLVLLIVAAFVFTNMFTKGVFSGRIYKEQNVYETIWNMVISEKQGTKTVLTSSTKDAYADYDLGEFQNIQIPECGVVISFFENELTFLFNKYDENGDWVRGEYIKFKYNYDDSTLYGNESESYLFEHFLVYYYSWVDGTEKYSKDNPGKYAFQYENQI